MFKLVLTSLLLASVWAAPLDSATETSISKGRTLWFPTTDKSPQRVPSQDDVEPINDEDTDIAGPNDIKYSMGRKVLTGNVRVHLLYYGTWKQSEKDIIEDYVSTIDNGTWWTSTRKYYYQMDATANKEYITGTISLGSVAQDTGYSMGKALRGNAIPDLFDKYIDEGLLPEDADAVYALLSSPDVKESIRDDLGPASFCQDYCGYHVSWVRPSKARLFYTFVGNPQPCLSGCSPNNQRISPNGNPGVDAMISVLAHELTEAVTDPISDIDDERAWQDQQGYENADKCAYQYGQTKFESGYRYNVVQGQRKYLIQANWSPVSPQKCVLSL